MEITESVLKKIKTESKKLGVKVELGEGVYGDSDRRFICIGDYGYKLNFEPRTEYCCTHAYIISDYNPIPLNVLTVAYKILETYALKTKAWGIEFSGNFNNEDKINFQNFGFKRIPNNLIDKWDLEKDYSEEELKKTNGSVWAKEVRKGIVKEIKHYATAFKVMYEQLKSEDVTTSFRGEISNTCYKAEFYYKGEKSIFLIEKHKDKIKFHAFNTFSDWKFDKEIFVTSIIDIDNVLSEYFNEVSERRKMINLVHAPREHFDKYFYKDKFSESLYDELLSLYDASEIEQIVASGNLSHIAQRDIHLIRFSNHYVLIDENNNFTIFGQSDKEIVITKYKSVQLKLHEEEIEESLQELEKNKLPYYMKSAKSR